MSIDAHWPADWNDRVAGIGCVMCGSPRADSDRYGVRIRSTPDIDAVLQRVDLQRGYTLVIWRGRHVAEPYELTGDEAAGYWGVVLRVAWALATHYRPLKMNYETLGNSVPHLHTHLIPRYREDPAPGRPFPLAPATEREPLSDAALGPDVEALRGLLRHE